MKTSSFLELLKEHQGKSLLFQYLPGAFVGANYHITEVKNITVDAVDCGARSDHWKETVIQLYESPQELDKTEFMSAYKALAILKKVHRIRPMDLEAELRVEYSNNNFHTAQLFVNDYEIQQKQLIFNLASRKTDCKAKEACGIPEPADDAVSCCSPQSGCC